MEQVRPLKGWGAIGRLVLLLLLLGVSGQGLADERGEAPLPLCAPRNWNEVEAWRGWARSTLPANDKAWAEEAKRYANNGDVWRWHERLFIAWQGGNVVTLSDCPFDDTMYAFLYERFDEAGQFHVVRANYYEDFAYALVSRRTGRVHTIPGLPVWAPDNRRFAWSACDLLNGKDDLAIMSPTGDGLRTEIATKIPCGLGGCRLSWEGPTVLAADCPRAVEKGNQRRVLRLTLDGVVWRETVGER